MPVLARRAGGAAAAGGLDFGWERDAPAVSGAAAGEQEPVGDPVVRGADGHPEVFGDLAQADIEPGTVLCGWCDGDVAEQGA
jgi:hypothetical protein